MWRCILELGTRSTRKTIGYYARKVLEFPVICWIPVRIVNHQLENLFIISLIFLGGSALDACEKAIAILEDSPNTNAGYGSNLTWDGKVECEAGIMESSTTNFGACSCISDVKNPISLARKICDKQSSLLQFGRIPPMILAGDGASYFARETGLKIVSTDQLISKKSESMFNYYKKVCIIIMNVKYNY